MSNIHDIDTAAVRARADKATAGPWSIGATSTRGESLIQIGVPHSLDARSLQISTPDVVFIAHARTDVPLLCDAVDALRAGIETQREVARQSTRDFNLRGQAIDDLTAALAAANARVKELEQACKIARESIETLPPDTFGESAKEVTAPDGEGGFMHWYIRDEILDTINKALTPATGEAAV